MRVKSPNRMRNKWIAGALNILPGAGYLYIGTRKPFAVLLLINCPLLLIVGGIADPQWIEEYANIRWTIWDTLVTMTGLAAFVVDAYFEAIRVNMTQTT